MSTNADVKSVLTIVSKVLRESADATKKSLDELESIEMKYRQEYEEAEKKKKELQKKNIIKYKEKCTSLSKYGMLMKLTLFNSFPEIAERTKIIIAQTIDFQ